MAIKYYLTSANDVSTLSSYLKTYPKKNMHMRDTKTRQGQSVLHYCNIIKLKNKNSIKCHASGKNINIRFDIDYNNGNPQQTIHQHSFTTQVEAIKFIEREFDRVIKQIHKNIASRNKIKYVDYKKGRYYVQRNNAGVPQPSAYYYVSQQGLFHQDFLANILKWDFKIIEGHG